MKAKAKALISILTAAIMLLIPIVAMASDPPAPVAKTGQTTSYRTGDDGYYQKGVASPSPRFTDNGDGTVTDNLTGLMWAKDANLINSVTKEWSDAVNYANNLSLGSGGCSTSYTDWRLPNRNELKSLIDASNYSPALPSGHPFTNVQSDFYWSSTPYPASTSNAWFVYMHLGDWSINRKTWNHYVWLVRDDNSAEPPAPVAKTGQTTSYVTGDDGYYQKGVASPSPRFTDNGDGTVTDNLTGLMWAKNANLNNGKMNWNDAIDYANNLSLGTLCGTPRTDWRLPNRNELNSLIDAGNYIPALPTGHPFTNVQSSDYYWSSTTYATHTLYAWHVYMHLGDVSNQIKTFGYYVWPVRSAN